MALDFPSNPVNGQIYGTYTYDSSVPGWRSTPDVATGMPAGSIMAWGTDTPPSNWLICNGAAVSRTTYASLFAAIGVSYGVGDGATTFNLPDLRGKVPVGKDATQAEFLNIAQTGGSKTTAKYGDGTTTGYGLDYTASLGTGDATGSNLPPYQVVNYIIKFSSGVSAGDSDLATRVAAVENKFNTGQNDAPAGSILQFGGTTAPTNWLICDGSAVSRATWPSLFAAIGTNYGSGDGSTTFNLPDLRGKAPVGRQDAIALGTATITVAAPGVVTTSAHGLSDGQLVYLTTTGALPTGLTAGTSYYVVNSTSTTFQLATTRGGTGITTTGTQSGTHTAYSADFDTLAKSNGEKNHILNIAEMPSHNHTGQPTKLFVNASANNETMSGAGSTALSPVTGYTGGGTAHNNLQPYVTVNYIIKATAGVSTNDSTFVTRVGAVETVNGIQDTRLTNLEYNSPNYLVNGAMDIWQRGTSGFTSGYAADRWFLNGANAGAQSTDVPTGFKYSLSATNTSASYAGISQRIESANAVTLVGQTITVSAWFKRTGATAGSSLTVNMDYATATDNFTTTTYAGFAYLTASAPTTGWVKYSGTFSFVAPSGVANGVQFTFKHDGPSASNLGGLWTGLQIEVGTAASAFRRNAPSLQAELATCMRYFYRVNGGTADGGLVQGHFYSTTELWCTITHPVPMRVCPTSSVYTGTGLSVYAGGGGNRGYNSYTTYGTSASQNMSMTVRFIVNSAMTAGYGGWAAGTGTYIQFDSEL